MKANNIHKDGKLAAIIAHVVPFAGLIIAYFINMESNDAFGKFYIKQVFGILVTFLLIGALLGFVPYAGVIYAFYICIFAFWAMSLFGSITNRYILVPFFGKWYQKLLK